MTAVGAGDRGRQVSSALTKCTSVVSDEVTIDLESSVSCCWLLGGWLLVCVVLPGTGGRCRVVCCDEAPQLGKGTERGARGEWCVLSLIIPPKRPNVGMFAVHNPSRPIIIS
jgi:hypothetical protein